MGRGTAGVRSQGNPKGRKVFIVLYRAGGSGSRLRKYTIGPYGRVTLHNARLEAQKVLVARLEGRDPASEKREARRRITVDTVTEIVALYTKQHLSKRRSGGEMTRLLQRELVARWGSRSIHEISKRDIIDLITAVVDRGAPVAANKTLKVTRAFFNWCLGRAILERSPCDGVKAPTIAKTRDRVLTDEELASVLLAARAMGGSYGAVVEILALTGQRREEVARMTWPEVGPCSPCLDPRGNAHQERQTACRPAFRFGSCGDPCATAFQYVCLSCERREAVQSLLRRKASPRRTLRCPGLATARSAPDDGFWHGSPWGAAAQEYRSVAQLPGHCCGGLVSKCLTTSPRVNPNTRRFRLVAGREDAKSDRALPGQTHVCRSCGGGAEEKSTISFQHLTCADGRSDAPAGSHPPP